MSKKSKKVEDALRKQNERKRRKNHLLCGLILGCVIGFAVGYCCRKYLSDDAKNRVVEKDFFRARLSEIKNKVQNLKDNFSDPKPLEDEIDESLNLE